MGRNMTKLCLYIYIINGIKYFAGNLHSQEQEQEQEHGLSMALTVEEQQFVGGD